MKIKIYGIEYNINLRKSNTRSDDNMGRVDPKIGIINIAEEMPNSVRFATLIHEIVEIINDNNELNLKHNQTQSLGTGIAEVLLENNIYSYMEIK